MSYPDPLLDAAGVIVFVLLLTGAAVLLGRYLARLFFRDRPPSIVGRLEGPGPPPARHRPLRRGDLARVCPRPPPLQRHRACVPLRPAPPPGRPPAQPGRRSGLLPRPRPEHRDLVRDQHQLAGVLGRGRRELPLPDGRVHGPELPLGRDRPRGRGRPDPRAQPPRDGPDRQLLGRPDPHRPRPPPPPRVRRGPPPRLAGCDPEPRPVRPRQWRFPDDRDGPRRLAGGDQGARDERRRVLQRELGPPLREPDPRSPTWSRSSCSSSSRPRSRSCSARPSATGDRGTSSTA